MDSTPMSTADWLRVAAVWLRNGSPELVDPDRLEEAADELDES